MVINFILSKLYFSVSFYYNFRGVYTKIVILAICEFALFVTIRQIMNAEKKTSVFIAIILCIIVLPFASIYICKTFIYVYRTIESSVRNNYEIEIYYAPNQYGSGRTTILLYENGNAVIYFSSIFGPADNGEFDEYRPALSKISLYDKNILNELINYVNTYEYKDIKNTYKDDENIDEDFDLVYYYYYYYYDYFIVLEDGTEIRVNAKDKHFRDLLSNLL